MLSNKDMCDTYFAAVRIFTHAGDECARDSVFVVQGDTRWDAVAAWLIAFTMGHGHSVTLMDCAGKVLAHRVSAVSKVMH